MPVRLLTHADRRALSAFPGEVPTEDLYAYFTLNGPDRAAIPARSAPANRLGFALSLCAVRYLGFCPEDLASVPGNVAFYVGQQLGVPAGALTRYPERGQTRTDHLGRVYALPPVAEDIALDLIETRTFDSRVIYERYRRVGGVL